MQRSKKIRLLWLAWLIILVILLVSGCASKQQPVAEPVAQSITINYTDQRQITNVSGENNRVEAKAIISAEQTAEPTLEQKLEQTSEQTHNSQAWLVWLGVVAAGAVLIYFLLKRWRIL